MTDQFKKYAKYIGLGLLAILLFGFGWYVRELGAQGQINSLIKDRDIKLEQIEVTKNKTTSLETALKRIARESSEERENLLDQIASLKSKPAEIRYITRVRTVVEGKTVVVKELPSSHQFQLANGLAVAEFLVDQDREEFSFNTADIEIEADVVTGERDTAVSLRATSSLDPESEIEISIDKVNVQQIRQHKLFEPNLLIGGSISVPAGTSPVGIGPSLGASFWHPKEHLSVGQIRLGTSGQLFQAGVDPIIWNTGDRLPVFTNLWVGPGLSINTAGQWSGTLTVGAKL